MRFLVTAGPTREPIDPVRYLSNRSSGKMGYAIAAAAIAAGHPTTLISGPVSLLPPGGLLAMIRVETAAQMLTAVHDAFDAADVLVMCAAVADFRPARAAAHKLKKADRAGLTLELERTVDILHSLVSHPVPPGSQRPLVVGFAAETRDLDPSAQWKLEAKRCDLVVGNDVSQTGIGFDGDDNELVLHFRDGSVRRLSRAPKRDLGTMLVEIITKLEKSA